MATVVYAGVAGILIGAYAYHFPETFVMVPGDRDPALFGDWYVDRGGSFRHYVFKKDGTGEIWSPGREMRPFRWGTEGERLKMKYHTPNGWSVPEYEFDSDSTSGQMSLKALTSGYNLDMKREPPPGASLQ